MGINLNLGCGPKRSQYNGYINCDKDPDLNPDVVLDVAIDTRALSAWKDNSVHAVLCENLFDSLEHEVSTRLIREIYRVLRPGGLFVFHCGDSAVNPAMCLGSWPYFSLRHGLVHQESSQASECHLPYNPLRAYGCSCVSLSNLHHDRS